jgi:hypothetical protein
VIRRVEVVVDVFTEWLGAAELCDEVNRPARKGSKKIQRIFAGDFARQEQGS